MLGDWGSALAPNSVNVAWTDFGSASSVWFDPNTVSRKLYDSLPKPESQSPLKPSLTYTPATPFSPAYVSGYTAIPTLNGAGFTDSITFLVDRPQHMTNLVSLTNFDAGTTPPIGARDAHGTIIPSNNLGYIPPNTFKVACQARQNSSSADPQNSSASGNLLNTLACAVIGSIGAGNVACIPAGYIAINNLPAAASSAASVVSSGANTDLFNTTGAAPFCTWLSAPVPCPSVGQTACLFNTSLPELFEWLTFAQTEGYRGVGAETVNGRTYNRAYDPLVENNDSASNHRPTDVIDSAIRIATTNAPAAQMQDLLALKSSVDYDYSFTAEDFRLGTRQQLLLCLGINSSGSPPKIQRELNELTVGSTVRPKSIFPLMDESINGKERSYIGSSALEIK